MRLLRAQQARSTQAGSRGIVGPMAGARRFHPKSETLQMGALLLWALGTLAIRQGIGLDPASGGPALVALLALATAAWLASGKRVDVDPVRGRVRTRWRLAGLPLGGREFGMDLERIELRPDTIRNLRDGVAHPSLVYDLTLVGREAGAELELALKEQQLLFRRAERKAREAARALDLPVTVRWDRLFDDLPRSERARGEWQRRFAYPPALADWRRWV